MSFMRRAGFLAAAAMSAAGLVSAPAVAAPAPAKVTSGEFVAIAIKPGTAGTKDEPPLFECHWNHGATPASGVAAINYYANFNCGPGPNPLSEIQAKMYSGKGQLEHAAPKDGPVFNGPVESKATFYGPRPGSQHYVRSLSRIELIMDPDGTKYWWYRLPEGCSGLGGYIATCDLRTEVFTYA
ncbi:hypothetical protein [Crossiella cryophila]|uniref:Uncharacterized protein n=1 Tax=Crossiella cryophila TaxID=43355 RepID=A0A7W7FUY8_9PSEU|nr:hypothetical protein [Crossiella cryophila]MBB4678515.1 hypothetical protein [Crossiella cryophila]